MNKVLYILFFCQLSIAVSAQGNANRPNLDGLVSSFHNLYMESDLLMDSLNIEPNIQTGLWNNFLLDEELTQVKKTSEIDRYLDSGFPDLGVKWVSEVNSNFRHDISDSEDIFSRFRLSTGLDWLIWGEGSLTRKRQETNYLKRKIERDDWANNIRLQDIDLKNKLYLLQDIFNIHRLSILQAYQSLISKIYQHELNMYNNNLIDKLPLLETKNEIESINNLIGLLNQYNQQIDDLSLSSKYRNLPFGYTDLPNILLIEQKILSSSRAKLLQLNKDVLNAQKTESTDFNIRFKFRYNYAEYQSHGGQTYPSVGLTVSVPLTFNSTNKQKEYELDQQEILFEQESISLLQELRSSHRHFYLLKKELIDLQNEEKQIKALLQAEVIKDQQSQQEFTPATYISLSKQLIQKKNDVLDKQQELCEEYIKFYLRAGFLNNDMDKFNSISHLTDKVVEKASTKLSTFLWGHFFQEKTNQELLNILNKTNINTVFLSAANSDSIKVADFIELCNHANIKIYRLIGENSYAASDDGHLKLSKKLESILSKGFAGVHLDIEPHTFADYRKHRNTYIERMNRILKETKHWCTQNNMAMSVSIPMHLPLEVAQILDEEKIDAYIMAYENKDHSKLLRRTVDLRHILRDHAAWTLRVDDFDSVDKLKETTVMLQHYSICNLAYYDCSLLDKIYNK